MWVFISVIPALEMLRQTDDCVPGQENETLYKYIHACITVGETEFQLNLWPTPREASNLRQQG